MIKYLLNQTKPLIIFTIVSFITSNSFSQTIKRDTLRNDKKYLSYTILAKKILMLIEENEDKVIEKYFEHPGTYSRANLKYNLSWVHKILQNNKHVSLKSMVLIKSEIPLSGNTFKNTDLSFTYSLGRFGCSDPTYDNNISIIFSDVEKAETHFDFIFDNCRESEKLKSEILNIHP